LLGPRVSLNLTQLGYGQGWVTKANTGFRLTDAGRQALLDDLSARGAQSLKELEPRSR
jgi:hypothetical protein